MKRKQQHSKYTLLSKSVRSFLQSPPEIAALPELTQYPAGCQRAIDGVLGEWTNCPQPQISLLPLIPFLLHSLAQNKLLRERTGCPGAPTEPTLGLTVTTGRKAAEYIKLSVDDQLPQISLPFLNFSRVSASHVLSLSALLSYCICGSLCLRFLSLVLKLGGFNLLRIYLTGRRTKQHGIFFFGCSPACLALRLWNNQLEESEEKGEGLWPQSVHQT